MGLGCLLIFDVWVVYEEFLVKENLGVKALFFSLLF